MGQDTQTKGKKAEFRMMSMLMDAGFTVFIPVVDVDGVDCVIKNNKNEFSEIQIKSSYATKQTYNFGGMFVKPRENYYFIFYVEKDKKYWVVPTLDFDTLWRKTTKEGSKHKGKYNVVIKQGMEKYIGEEGLKLLRDS